MGAIVDGRERRSVILSIAPFCRLQLCLPTNRLYHVDWSTTIITSDQSKLTTGRIAVARTVQWYSPGGASVHSHLKHASLGPSESKSIPNGISIVSAVLHSSQQNGPILYNGPQLPRQNLPLPMGIWTHTLFYGPTRVLNPNGISIGPTFFTGLSGLLL